MNDVIIIGAGLFGQAIGNELIRLGREVVFIDDERPEAGSAPSGMLTKPGWYQSMGRKVYEPALENLQINYSLQECQFDLGISKHGKVKVGGVYYVSPKDVLRNPHEKATVQSVGTDGQVHTMGATLKAKLVIVAAGVWANQLVPVPKMQGKKGVSFFFKVPKDLETTDIIRLWAPYKHLVLHRRSPTEVWTGDGTAILPENWKDERVAECLARIYKHTGLPKDLPVKAIMGIRPYVPKARPCYVEQISPNVWIATGGAKNGLIAAGWAAWKIGQEVC